MKYKVPIEFQEITLPNNPASGYRKVYSKNDGIYMLDSLGNETKLGSSTTLANNGLTKLVNTIELGGTLTKNTTINLSTFNLVFTNVGTGSAGTDSALLLDTSGNLKKVLASSLGVTNSAGPNILPKSDGTNLVGSNIEDNGFTVTINADVYISSNIVDISSETVINLSSRSLTDSSSNVIFDWENKRFYNSANITLDFSGASDIAILVKGITNDNTKHALRIINSDNTNIFNVRNDGSITIYGGGAFDETFGIRQRDFSFTHIVDIYNANFSKLGLRITDNGSTGQITIGDSIVNIDNYTGGVGMGIGSGTTRLTLNHMGVSGDVFFVRVFGGSGGFLISDDGTGSVRAYMQDITGSSTQVLFSSSGGSYFNGGNLLVGGTTVPAGTKLKTIGASATNADYSFIASSSGANVFSVRNDGEVGIESGGSLRLSQLTATTVPYLNASKILTSSSVTPTELGYISGVTSAIQTQINFAKLEFFPIAASDETTPLTTGVKTTLRMPYAMTLTSVRASLTTAQASGSIFTIDVKENGVSIFSTLLTIDNTEKTSTTATTAAVISDSALADDSEITINITQVGDGTAVGLKIYLLGTR